MYNPFKPEKPAAAPAGPLTLATVGTVSEEGVTLILPGASEPTQAHYPNFSSSSLASGDSVIISRVSGTWVVMGKAGGGGGGTADALPLAGGTMAGNINMNSNKVTNLPPPSANGDAVPKSYADGLLSGYRTAADQDAIDATDIIVVNIASYSGSQVRVPASGTNAAITASHVLLASTVGTPANQTGDWTVTTYNGYLTLSGPASAATTVQLVLGKAGTTI